MFNSPAKAAEEYLSGIQWPKPPVVTPAEQNALPPSDAIVLFDGKDLSAWNHADTWTLENGTITTGKRGLETKQKFGDCQLHLEWSVPVDFGNGTGQGRGNSGVLFMPHRNKMTGEFAKYEIQILDSYQSETYPDGQAGAIYKQNPPMVNAMRPPGEWNTYDAIFIAPKFREDGSLQSPAYITLFHNGILVQHNFSLTGTTAWNRPPAYAQHNAKLPIQLQSKGQRVRFRNIWVREIQPIVGKQVKPPSYIDHKTGKTRLADTPDQKDQSATSR